MSKNDSLINFVNQLAPYFPEISEEKAKELEWFVKRVAVEAVTTDNKSEFVEILEKNDLLELADFIKKYVPDFKNKLENFLERS